MSQDSHTVISVLVPLLPFLFFLLFMRKKAEFFQNSLHPGRMNCVQTFPSLWSCLSFLSCFVFGSHFPFSILFFSLSLCVCSNFLSFPFSSNLHGFKIMAFPVRLENICYPRNALSFSLGFVLHPDANPLPFEIILRKLSNSIENLEVYRCLGVSVLAYQS